MDHVAPEMMRPEEWIAPGMDKVILTPEEIGCFNRDLRMGTAFGEDLFVSLDDAPDTFSRAEVRKMIGIYEAPDPPGRFVGGKPTDRAYWEKVLANRALELIPDEAAVRRGFSVRRGMINMFPAADFMGEDASERYCDLNTSSECMPFLPLLVIHESRDGEWAFCIFYNLAGWVRKECIALCRDKEDWERRRRPGQVLTVCGRLLRLFDDPFCPELAGQLLPMGTHLPLVPPAEAPIYVRGRGTFGNYVALLPVRGEDGMIRDEYFLIPVSEDVMPGLMPYTRENEIRQVFKLCGDVYGWGGAHNAGDCSGIIHEIFCCFGFVLPRGAAGEAGMEPALRTDVSGMPADQKRCLLEKVSPGAFLYMPGHIMIWLGMRGGRGYVISAAGSAVYGGELVPIRGVAVTELGSVFRKNGASWLDSITSVTEI